VPYLRGMPVSTCKTFQSVDDLQFDQEWMSDTLQDRSFGIDMFYLFQPYDLGLVEDLHGIVRELTIDFCRFLRCRSIGVSRLLEFWEYRMIRERAIVRTQSYQQYTAECSRPLPRIVRSSWSRIEAMVLT
jgi:hypothetical protein